MIILALQDVKKSFGTHEVLKSVSFTLQEGERMGMVGVNGSGKSTLMKIIAGIETADSGSGNMQKGLRIGYLAQQGELTGEETVLETLESVFEPQRRMEEELRALEQEMAVSGSDPDALRILGSRYDALTREFERSNGYGWRSSVQGVLAGLKLREFQDMKTGLLSGGERTRLCLGRMLLTDPDLLLLDEPTNHLDLKSIAWLEDYLAGFRGAVLVISHDRYFMDRVCGRMAELLMGNVETYNGNYTEYLEKRTEVYEIRMKAWKLQQKEIARQEAIIEMYRSFNKELERTGQFAAMGITNRCFFAANTINAFGNPYCEYPPIWKGFKKYDWSAFDAQVEDLVKASPNARFMVMIDLNTPYWATHKFHLDSFTDITHAGVMPEWRNRTKEWMLDFIAYAEKKIASAHTSSPAAARASGTNTTVAARATRRTRAGGDGARRGISPSARSRRLRRRSAAPRLRTLSMIPPPSRRRSGLFRKVISLSTFRPSRL